MTWVWWSIWPRTFRLRRVGATTTQTRRSMHSTSQRSCGSSATSPYSSSTQTLSQSHPKTTLKKPCKIRKVSARLSIRKIESGAFWKVSSRSAIAALWFGHWPRKTSCRTWPISLWTTCGPNSLSKSTRFAERSWIASKRSNWTTNHLMEKCFTIWPNPTSTPSTPEPSPPSSPVGATSAKMSAKKQWWTLIRSLKSSFTMILARGAPCWRASSSRSTSRPSSKPWANSTRRQWARSKTCFIHSWSSRWTRSWSCTRWKTRRRRIRSVRTSYREIITRLRKSWIMMSMIAWRASTSRS